MRHHHVRSLDAGIDTGAQRQARLVLTDAQVGICMHDGHLLSCIRLALQPALHLCVPNLGFVIPWLLYLQESSLKAAIEQAHGARFNKKAGEKPPGRYTDVRRLRMSLR